MRILKALALIAAIAMASVVPGATASVSGPDPAVKKWPTWPYEVTCHGLPFNPIGVFGGTPGAQTGSQPYEVALREFLTKNTLPWIPPSQWRLVAANDEQAEFVSGQLPTELDWLLFKHEAAGWKWSGSAGCTPRSLRDGVSASQWFPWRESVALLPRTRVLKIGIQELSCTGGANPASRIETPDVQYSKNRLIVTTWVEPLPLDAYECPSNPAAPYKIKLPRPLGRRVLLDGGTYPPVRRATTLSRSTRRAFPSSG